MEMLAKIGSQIACIHAWLTLSPDLETLKDKTQWNETKNHIYRILTFFLFIYFTFCTLLLVFSSESIN